MGPPGKLNTLWKYFLNPATCMQHSIFPVDQTFSVFGSLFVSWENCGHSLPVLDHCPEEWPRNSSCDSPKTQGSSVHSPGGWPHFRCKSRWQWEDICIYRSNWYHAQQIGKTKHTATAVSVAHFTQSWALCWAPGRKETVLEFLLAGSTMWGVKVITGCSQSRDSECHSHWHR